jgi:Ca2+-transporting ATPase
MGHPKSAMQGDDRMTREQSILSRRFTANSWQVCPTRFPARAKRCLVPVMNTLADLEPAAWHQLPVAEVLTRLGTSADRGLAAGEVEQRARRFGPNALHATATPAAWRRFLAQFRNTLVLLLLVATAISTALWLIERDTAAPYDAIAIFAVVLLNAAMGFIQESRAEASVAALREMTGPTATVLRDGQRERIASEAIVPGDVLVLDEGDTVAADARVISLASLKTMEAALTGESLPIAKAIAPVSEDSPLGDRRSMVFSGTTVVYGHGAAVVTATGMQTEVGRIAGLIERTADAPTPMQVELDRVAKGLGRAVLIIAAIIVGTVLTLDDSAGVAGLASALLLGVALAVAAVPEGLPAVVTAVLAIGVRRMAKRRAIVRHIGAVETLGSATVIASDKTGTLTLNRMTVRAIVTAAGRVDPARDAADLSPEARWALTIGDLANNSTPGHTGSDAHGDPTELALRVAAAQSGIDHATAVARWPRLAEVPFSSDRKLMTTVHQGAEGSVVAFTKGAPDVLLPRCTFERVGDEPRPLSDARRAEILAAAEALGDEALRTLAVASRFLDGESPLDESIERELEFAGTIGMIDPPRPEAKDAVRRARDAGIRPLMITGDHPRTAAVIAAELGIGDGMTAVGGADIDALDDAALDAVTARRSVFARVSPAHKLRIVASLRRQGHVVAMTGDGVNDAPALKSADIGVAMGLAGTDVAREAADVVLADDNFATIVVAVEEGRAIYANVRKFLRYLLSSNIGEVLTMFGGLVLGRTIGLVSPDGAFVAPLLATQILWINLVTDGPPALALGVDPPESAVMQRPPRPRGEPVITAGMWREIVFVGLIMAVAALAVVDADLPGGFIHGDGTVIHARTMAFTTLMLCQLFNLLNARSIEASAFDGLFTNRWLWGAITLSVVLQIAVVQAPVLQAAFGTTALALSDWAGCAAAASTVLWARELGKWSRRARHAPSRLAASGEASLGTHDIPIGPDRPSR